MISMQGNSEADRGAGARADARSVLAILGALAAASAGACGDDGTGIGATSVLPTSTGNLTTAADDDDDDDFPDDDDDDNDDDDDDNDDDDDDESTGGGADGTDSSGGSSSTGCEVGTEGCECSEDDPPCEDGLECIADLCSAALCPDDDEDPSNDIPQDAIDQGDFDDGGNGDTITSQLAGTEDVDWFSWTCNDTLIPELDPSVQITNNDPLRVCLFLDCAVGGNPTQFSCGGNATEESINFEFLDGCCVSDGSSFDIDYNCPDSDNDSVIGYLRVDTAQEEICIDYQVDFSC